MDDSEYAATEAATFAHSDQDAQAQLLQQLQNAKLELIENYQCSSFNGAKWVANSEYRQDIFRLIEEIELSGEFRFGVFRCVDT